MRLRSGTNKSPQNLPYMKSLVRNQKLKATKKRARINIESKSNVKTTLEQENPGAPQISQKNKKFKPFVLETASPYTDQQEKDNHFVPLNSLSAEQAAFSIPKIRAKILSYVDPQDLLQYRLVSRDWRRDATNETLLNWGNNTTYLSTTEAIVDPSRPWKPGPYRRIKEPMPVRELTKLMNKTKSNPFPCFQFEIVYTNWKIEGNEIQTFLTAHGFRMRKLKVNLLYDGSCQDYSFCGHRRNWVFNVLNKLLLYQTPNLEEIQVCFDEDSPSMKRNPCKNVLAKKAINQVPGVLNTTLRSGIISDNLPVTVFEFMCELAPNLKENNISITN